MKTARGGDFLGLFFWCLREKCGLCVILAIYGHLRVFMRF